MADINTTSIHDLPTEASVGGSIGGTIGGGVSVDHPPNSSITLDDKSISQIVNGIQQASLAGATQLPSRDIPLQTEQLTNDPQIQPNYIPKPSQKDIDYINDSNTNNINEYYRAEKNQHTLDDLYDELQAPLLLSVLYLLFQLPIFRKTVFTYLPFFCNTDGNYNFNGFVFTCVLFGFIYYSLTKTVKYFSKF
jgi:hypothetical protein